MSRTLGVVATVALVAGICTPQLSAQVAEVTAIVETDPVPTDDDAADDAAIWIHPHDPSRSLVIGTDKRGGGLAVYDLAGWELQYDGSVRPNNVDVRYGFPLGGSSVDLVAFSEREEGTIGTYVVDPVARRVGDVGAGMIDLDFSPAGLCLYRSPTSGRWYAFVVGTRGELEQWELFDDGTGKVDGRLVRSLDVGDETEACTVDDALGRLYVSEEPVGIWRYGAEPGDGARRTLVDASDGSGHLTADVEGLAIYQTSDGDGYLIASSQGSDGFVIYERRSGYHVGTFRIVDGAVDGVSNTDGIDVTNVDLGPRFPEGLFVAQDGENPGANQNFKYVPWGAIARSFRPRLTIDTGFDPRGDVGGGRVRIRVARGPDDAEERRSGRMVLSDERLELVRDRRNQTVGLRFTGVAVPRGARITRGWIRFTVAEAAAGAITLVIRGQAADDARRFRRVDGDLSSRRLTNAQVRWRPSAWGTVGASGRGQRTPDLSELIQEIVDRPRWAPGNALVLVITGSGRRVAMSSEGDRSAAALLSLRYR